MCTFRGTVPPGCKNNEYSIRRNYCKKKKNKRDKVLHFDGACNTTTKIIYMDSVFDTEGGGGEHWDPQSSL